MSGEKGVFAVSFVVCPTSREVVSASMLGDVVIQTGRSPSAMLIKSAMSKTPAMIRIAASGLLLSIFSRIFREESLSLSLILIIKTSAVFFYGNFSILSKTKSAYPLVGLDKKG